MVSCAMDPTKLRLRYLLVIFLAAVVTAAALRHFLHVDAGYSREQIRLLALIPAVIGIFLVVAFVRWRRRRP
jgi:heme/copper-type cytochrome/quinol oxidase subunit 4